MISILCLAFGFGLGWLTWPAMDRQLTKLAHWFVRKVGAQEPEPMELGWLPAYFDPRPHAEAERRGYDTWEHEIELPLFLRKIAD